MNDLQILIDQYLSGHLDAEAKARFEQRVAEDPEVAEALEQERQLRQMVVLAGRRDLRAKMEQWEGQQEVKPSKSNWRWLYPLGLVAAGLAIFFISTLLFDWWETPLEGPVAFDQYFEVYRSPVSRRGSAEDSTALAFNQAMSFYKTGDYAPTITALQKVVSTPEGIPDYLVQFYLGMAHLADTPIQVQLAIEALQKVGVGQNDYQQQALWYLALAELQQENWSACRSHLQQLLRYQDYKKIAAQELLQRLPN